MQRPGRHQRSPGSTGHLGLQGQAFDATLHACMCWLGRTSRHAQPQSHRPYTPNQCRPTNKSSNDVSSYLGHHAHGVAKLALHRQRITGQLGGQDTGAVAVLVKPAHLLCMTASSNMCSCKRHAGPMLPGPWATHVVFPPPADPPAHSHMATQPPPTWRSRAANMRTRTRRPSFWPM